MAQSNRKEMKMAVISNELVRSPMVGIPLTEFFDTAGSVGMATSLKEFGHRFAQEGRSPWRLVAFEPVKTK